MAAADDRLTVGVLGGMGPAATFDFCRRLVAATAAESDADHLHVIVDSDPSIPDRTAALEGRGPDPTPALRAAAQRLVTAGSELICVPCNTAGAFLAAVRQEVPVPLLDLVEEAAAGVHARAPAGPIGILATDGTVAAGLYHRALAAVGRGVLVPEGPVQRQVMEVIYAVKAGSAGDRLRRTGAEAAAGLCGRGARAVVLACTELSALFHDGPPPHSVDASQMLAERVVALAGGRLRT
jgi:aspartate racemase